MEHSKCFADLHVRRKGLVMRMKMRETQCGEKLPEAELDIMLVLWQQKRPMKVIEILEELKDTRDWKKPTLQVLLGRLEARGFLKVTQEANYHLYEPLISEDEYRLVESQHFLKKMCRGSFRTLVASFVKLNQISDKELQELYTLLEERKDTRERD